MATDLGGPRCKRCHANFMIEQKSGLAILGEIGIARRHLEAIERLPSLYLVGYASEDVAIEPDPLDDELESAFSARRYGSCDEAIEDPAVRGMVICTLPSQRAYWSGRAAAAGKHVLCESPAATSLAAAQDLIGCCQTNGVGFALADALLDSGITQRARRLATEAELGRLLFVDVQIWVPRARVARSENGVLLEYATGMASLPESTFGRIDSVYGRTRSLALSRPQEDVAVAQLRLANGVEGLFQVNGLADRSELRIEMHGSKGSARLVQESAIESSNGLARVYEDFADLLHRNRCPPHGGETMREGLLAVEWIQQSARLDREVHRRELCHERRPNRGDSISTET